MTTFMADSALTTEATSDPRMAPEAGHRWI
jgi:hypothetical protein